VVLTRKPKIPIDPDAVFMIILLYAILYITRGRDPSHLYSWSMYKGTSRWWHGGPFYKCLPIYIWCIIYNVRLGLKEMLRTKPINCIGSLYNMFRHPILSPLATWVQNPSPASSDSKCSTTAGAEWLCQSNHLHFIGRFSLLLPHYITYILALMITDDGEFQIFDEKDTFWNIVHFIITIYDLSICYLLYILTIII